MRTVFLGTPSSAVPSLRALARSAHAPRAVACQPDRPAGRGRRIASPPVKAAALELGLEVLQPESTGTARFRQQVASFEPEVLVVVAYGRILGPKLLAVAPRGAVNVHFSLLPRWRGAAPVQRALLAGDRVTGVSIMRIVAELDAGPVLRRAEVSIGADERADALEARLAEIGAAELVAALDDMEAGRGRETPQDAAEATHAPPLSRHDGHVEPAAAAEDIARAVRALHPWPGVQLDLGRGVVQLLDVEVLSDAATDPPGTVLPPRGEVLPLVCGGGTVLGLVRVRPEGRRPMPGRSLVDGRWTCAGDLARRVPDPRAAT